MVLTSNLGLVLLLVTVVATGFAASYSMSEKARNPFSERDLVKKGMDRPVIWLYYDTSEVSSRWWFDFGARSSRALDGAARQGDVRLVSAYERAADYDVRPVNHLAATQGSRF